MLLNSSLNRIFNYALTDKAIQAQLSNPDVDVSLPAQEHANGLRQVLLRTLSSGQVQLDHRSDCPTPAVQETFFLTQEPHSDVAIGWDLQQPVLPYKQDATEYSQSVTLATEMLCSYFRKFNAPSGDRDILAAGVSNIRQQLGKQSLGTILSMPPRSSTISF